MRNQLELAAASNEAIRGHIDTEKMSQKQLRASLELEQSLSAGQKKRIDWLLDSQRTGAAKALVGLFKRRLGPLQAAPNPNPHPNPNPNPNPNPHANWIGWVPSKPRQPSLR